jgi:predicted enzyme related to lactoylglutathione lyase
MRGKEDRGAHVVEEFVVLGLPRPTTSRAASQRTSKSEGDPTRTLGSSEDERPYKLPPVVDLRLELVQVPVSDVDRAKAFYTDKAGFSLDHDHTVSEEIRFVQLTPPGSACSIALGKGLSDMEPGFVRGLQLVVEDIEMARAELAKRGVEVSEVQHFPWGSFVFFSDPDGNGWAVQQLPEG